MIFPLLLKVRSSISMDKKKFKGVPKLSDRGSFTYVKYLEYFSESEFYLWK